MSSGSLTRNATGVPGSSRETAPFATASARTSSSDRNGSWRSHAIAEPASIANVSAAVTTTASVRRRSSRCHTRTSPSAARIGIANPNVTNRSAGSHPVTSANATPTNVSTNHERRIRPALPLGAVKPTSGERHRDPLDVPRPAMHEAVEVRAPQLGRETGTSEERVLRRVDLQRRRPRSHGQQPDPEHGAAPERRPPPAGTPPDGRSATRRRPPRAGSRDTPGGTAGGRGRPPRARARRGRPPGVSDRPAARPPRGTPRP